jgi:hypothetical protein
MVLPNTHDPFADQNPYGRPKLQDELEKHLHCAIRLLAIIVGGSQLLNS